MELQFQVKNQRLYLTTVNKVVADSQGYLTAAFTFTSDWDGAVKIAQFTRGTTTTNVGVNATTGKCSVPTSVLSGEGEFFVSVYGTKNSETVIITVNAIRIQVLPSGLITDAGTISQAEAAALAAHADAVETVTENASESVGGHVHTLLFIVKNQSLYLNTRGRVVADSQGYLGAKFQFTEDWDGTVKVAQFKRGDLFYSILLDTNDECTIPWEVLVDEGIFIVNVYGNNQENAENRIITANPIEVYVEKSGLTAGELPDDPTEGIDGQTLYEIRQYAARAEAAAQTAVDAKDLALGYSQNASQSASDASGYASDASDSATAAAASAESAAEDAASLGDAVQTVEELVYGMAPIYSPTFTGEPKAPTPIAGDDSTKLATTEFVQDELESYATLASPALTGTPTAPTPASGDNSTRIATTAYVQGELDSITIESDDVVAMTGYSKPLATSAISSSDTLNEAIGKLEKAWENVDAQFADYATLNDLDDYVELTSASYIKSASVSGDTLTLTKGDDTTVAYTPDIPTKVSDLTNDSGYATTTYVDTATTNAISGLVASAPTALDTLEELANALGDDPNFATTVTTLIGTKVTTGSADYIKSASVSGRELTLTKGNDTTVTFAKDAVYMAHDSNGHLCVYYGRTI